MERLKMVNDSDSEDESNLRVQRDENNEEVEDSN